MKSNNFKEYNISRNFRKCRHGRSWLRRLVFLSLFMVISLCACGKKDHSFVLSLDANPDSGFDWKITQADEIFAVSSEYVHANNGDGAGGTQTFTLTPTETGFTNITFTSEQRGDGGQKGAKYSYSVIVDEDLAIEVVTKSGEMAGAALSSARIPDPVVQ